MQISAVIITFNEENNIAAAIRSVDWADEVLVVDSESTDHTLEISKSVGARVISRPWPGFSEQKQFGVDSAEFDWILSLDADERVSPELARSIQGLREKKEIADAYSVSRLPFYMGRPIKHCGWYPDRPIRLFDRRKASWTNAIVHESVAMSPETKVGSLHGELLHFSVTSAAEHHRMIGERYSPLGARQMLERGRKSRPLKAAATGIATFLKIYILKLGVLDGFPGFCIAWFGAHHAFLKHLMLIESQRTADRRSDNQPFS
ncbi:MAG: glycosyltransferase family 2 protein [Pyrinomonadaceae bacterium]